MNDPEIIRTRFVVVGSGVAGLWTACELCQYGSVLVVTKRRMDDTSTNHAQGGIAVALCPGDSPSYHAQDTLAAGAGLCDEPAVEVLTREGPQRVMGLVAMGARFDQYNGELHCRREAAHGEPRIIHAHGDATGAEIQRALDEACAQRDNLTVLEYTQAVRLLTQGEEVVGLDAMEVGEGRKMRILADATVLASGGYAAIYSYCTSPRVATGDAMALAYRAGAVLEDMEFVQFHPTGLRTEEMPAPLISEAVRGEGAVLRNQAGEAFMKKYHPLADLAPRDVVSRAEFTEMQQAGTDHCWLDFSPIPPERLRMNFPTILEMLEAHGIEVPEEMAPVRPVAHYTMGGVYTDLHAHSSLRRLYAVGECTCTGVHGANRLASNSLLEGLVFGSRAAQAAASEEELPSTVVGDLRDFPEGPLPRAPVELADEIRALMWDKVGIVRQGEGLQEACDRLAEMVAASEAAATPEGSAEEAETANMALIAYLTTLAALRREESRGGHFRTDFPKPREEWRWHQRVRLGPEGKPVFVLRKVLSS